MYHTCKVIVVETDYVYVVSCTYMTKLSGGLHEPIRVCMQAFQLVSGALNNASVHDQTVLCLY